MDFTLQEILDLTRAIIEAQAELCTGANMPEANAYNNRLEALYNRLKEYGIKD